MDLKILQIWSSHTIQQVTYIPRPHLNEKSTHTFFSKFDSNIQEKSTERSLVTSNPLPLNP